MAEETLSIDQCPDCGGWLGPVGEEVFDGTTAGCDDCGAEWEASVLDGAVVWIAVEPGADEDGEDLCADHPRRQEGSA